MSSEFNSIVAIKDYQRYTKYLILSVVRMIVLYLPFQV